MRSICHDFNNIGGELARRLASLFGFLEPDPSTDTQTDPLELSLYADPAYWLYGLLSFCAKACEFKIEEANGTPILRAKDERGTPDIEATGRTLALMQTVVMSFGRNQSLGKPDLPIHHLHVYFPVQLVHKLVERMKTDLQFTDATPEDGKKYKRNSESETNSPYIVVGAFESVCPSERTRLRFDTFYRTMDLTNPIKAMQYDQTEAEQAEQAEQAPHAEQTNEPTQHTAVGTSTLATASTDSQSTDRQANVAAIGSNQY